MDVTRFWWVRHGPTHEKAFTGWRDVPADLSDSAALARLDLSGITPPAVREGTVGAQARSLGAAAIPLSQRYLLDQNAAQRDA